MDKETLSNYGWIVICVMVLAVMLAFASPFGNFIANAIKSTTQGLFDVNQGALDAAGIQIMGQEFEEMLNGTSQNDCPVKYGEPYSMSDTESAVIYVFHKDGSIDFTWLYQGEVLISDTMPAGTCGYDGLNLTGIDEETGETIVIATITADGKQIDMGEGGLLTLGSPCIHTSKEIVEVDAQSGNLCCTDCDAVIRTIYKCPTNGTYYAGVTSDVIGNYTSATAIYTAGEYILTPPESGDVFVCGDYEYRYSKSYGGEKWYSSYENGWGVRVLDDTKETYGTIVPSINGSLIINLNCTFWKCKNLISTGVPEIPMGVQRMNSTFFYCSSLTSVKDMQIPNSVVQLDNTFTGCSKLTNDGMPIIPNSVVKMGQTFSSCTGLTDLSNFVIPNSVTYMYATFSGCTALEVAPVLPTSVTDIHQVFFCCDKLKSYAGSTDADGDFSNYNIPTAAGYKLSGLFSSCDYITHSPTINGDVEDIDFLFQHCPSIRSIRFNGTMEQWNAIERKTAWNQGCPEITITCNDGTIIVPANNS